MSAHSLKLVVIAACFISSGTAGAFAADESFVGILALAVDEEVAKEIGLSSQKRSELESLVDDREAEALEMALSMRDLPAEQQTAKLAKFRADSEKLGLARLSKAQQEALESARVRRKGMSALSEQAVAQRLQLDDEQQAKVAELMAARDAALANAGSSKAVVIRANFERQLKAVLSDEQIGSWSTLTASNAKPKEEVARFVASKNQRARPAKTSASGGSDTLQFSFSYAPWQNVIEWFAEQCELSLLMDAPPQGTFNYTDPREYSRAQAIDLLNSVLLTKGYTLVRRENMLMVVNLADGIPPNLITEVAEEDLDELGEYELVRCVFTLQSVNAEEAQEEIDRLLGPQGTVHVLTSSNQLAITETAGRLRTFRRILQQGERQNASALGQAQLIPLEHVRASKIIASWRKLMGLTDEDNATLDGALRVTQGKTSRELLVSGKPNSLREFEDLVELLDIPSGLGPREIPQLEVYSVTEADPESVLKVLDTLFEGADDIRLATDPKTGSLVALARPEQHETIQATIKQLQADRRKVEVIRLRSVDPQLAMLSIEKLFAPSLAEGDEAVANNAPLVDADPVTRSLLIRGSEAQIEDIRTLLAKMGEDESTSGRGGLAGGNGSNLRMIPIDAGTARRAMEQLNTIWPTIRSNQIRTVAPAERIRGIRMGIPRGRNVPPRDGSSEQESSERSSPLEDRSDEDFSTFHEPQVQPVPTRFVSTEAEAQTVAAPDAQSVAGLAKRSDAGAPENQVTSDELPEIIVTIGDQGLIIASEDTAALDEFEELFLTLSDRLFAGSRQLTIFYLRFAKAEVAAEFVKQFVGGGSGGSSGGGTLLGNLASSALGGAGGGIIGSLLGGGGGSSASVSLSKGTAVIADPRLNALVVRATPKELDFIEGLLEVLDRANSPQVIETVPRPRSIPVINTDAEEVADVVRSVYATRLAGGSSGGGRRREPSPEDFIKAMTGQKDTGKQVAAAIGEQVGITISVDTRRNSLIVIAPESLFREIKDLVADLDFPKPELAETVRYGSVGDSSPEIIRSVIETLVDEEQDTPNNSSAREKRSSERPSEQRNPGQGIEEMKRRMEFFKAIQKANAKDRAAAAKKEGRGKK